MKARSLRGCICPIFMSVTRLNSGSVMYQPPLDYACGRENLISFQRASVLVMAILL